MHVKPKFELIVNGAKVGTFTPDFGYAENGRGVDVVDDTKGVLTEAFNLRAKLFQALYPDIELRINGVAAKRPKGAPEWLPRKAVP